MKELYIGRDGAKLGPYTEDQVSRMIATQQIQPDDVGWIAGMPA